MFMFSAESLLAHADARPQPLSLLMVGDPQEWISRGRQLVGGHPDLLLLGVVDSGAEAVDLVLHLQPDMVVVDVKTSDLSGFEVARRLHSLARSGRTVIAGPTDGLRLRYEAQAAGATAFVAKHSLMSERLLALAPTAARFPQIAA
jgi:DNA-binding NarL/FixJ family response regulator